MFDGLFNGSMLALDASFFSTGDTSAAYIIWQYMQGFANVAIAAILMIIIISQITGKGIDNYGIKKMLPKLIVMAILINMSYIICQVLIDVSNIAGEGIAAIGEEAHNRVLSALGSNVVEVGFGALFAAIFATAAGGASLITETIMLAGTGLWAWIPLLFVVIGAVVSVVIFLLLLALRQLLAIVLVAISPLAFVCYILPNTENLFKKWKEGIRGVIVIYPVCAAMYAISRVFQAVAFSAGGLHIFMVIVALVSAFIPLALAPALVRRSMNAMGELGTFINNAGERLRGGVRNIQSQVRGSEAYKQAQRDSMVHHAERNAEAYRQMTRDPEHASWMQRRRYGLMRISGGRGRDENAVRSFAHASQVVDRANAEDVERERVAMREETGNYNVEIMGNQLTELLNNYDGLDESGRMRTRALMSQLSQQSGGAKKIYNAANNRQGAAAVAIGEYMAQNDKVRAALESKSRRTASRISDISSGVVGANTTQENYDNMNNAYLNYRREAVAANEQVMNENDWRAAQAAAGNNVSDESVIHNIANNVLDKDKDFVTQSGGEVKALIGHIDQTRIDSIASNTQLLNQGDVAEGVKAEFAARATPVPTNGGPQPGTDPYIEDRIRALGIDPNSEYANQLRRNGFGS